jgi:hypothetical protein
LAGSERVRVTQATG